MTPLDAALEKARKLDLSHELVPADQSFFRGQVCRHCEVSEFAANLKDWCSVRVARALLTAKKEALVALEAKADDSGRDTDRDDIMLMIEKRIEEIEKCLK